MWAASLGRRSEKTSGFQANIEFTASVAVNSICNEYAVMAKYRIKSLNYMSTGEGRRFVNMDTELDCAQNFVHLLALEPNVGKADPLSADVLLE